MTYRWMSVIGTVFYYLSLPFTTLLTTLLGWVLGILAPVVYLGQFMLSAFTLPLSLFARLETVYIYLGVAAVVGLATGAILHLFSSVLVSLFNLSPSPEERGRTAASVRAAREKKKLQQAWQSATIEAENSGGRRDNLGDKYAEWLERDLSQRGEDQGLLGVTGVILEEDDSEDGF